MKIRASDFTPLELHEMALGVRPLPRGDRVGDLDADRDDDDDDADLLRELLGPAERDPYAWRSPPRRS